MRASVIILGFLATLTVALPEAYPKVEIACQSVSLLDGHDVRECGATISNELTRTPCPARLLTALAKDAVVRDLLADSMV
ncbi:hypothetical protein N7537_010210 [Penicillium hordei]|uniref:Uncharacterized protein n=1 Tax=Penicillium hordei TaxID=40994 RepID=A0AAD6DUA1_9EURO|nr:uncharacterized protein N7537_010210 [Penicillium hordei]KAJ5593306.1 hypothetical protein N7537_010210 [Penicillium hordei]